MPDQSMSSAGIDNGPASPRAMTGSAPDTTGNPVCAWSLADLARRPYHRGAIEHFDGNGIRGWCLRTDDPSSPVTIDIMLLGVRLCTCSTTIHRPDISEALGLRVTAGFSIAWSSIILPAATFAMVAERAGAAADTRAALSVEIPGQEGDGLSLLEGVEVALSNAALAEILAEQLLPEGDIVGIDRLIVHARFHLPAPGRMAAPALTVDGVVVDAMPTGEADTGDFKFVLPANVVDGAVHQIAVAPARNPGLVIGGVIERRFSVVEEAAWNVRGTRLEGWLVAFCDRSGVTLDIQADGVSATTLALDVRAGELVSFAHTLPMRLIDGQAHELSVLVQDEPGSFLPHVFGGTIQSFCRRILSNIESIGGGWIRGWAFNVEDPAARIEIELREGPTVLGRATPGDPRQDVNKAFGVKGTHGFGLAMPEACFDGRPHQLTLTINGEEISIPPQQRLPAVLDRWLISDVALRYRGKVELATANEVAGWAANLSAPHEPVSVSIFVDGVFEAMISAKHFSKRLQPVTGSGYHIFQYRFPVRLMNNSERTIEVFVTDGHVPLEIVLPDGQRTYKATVLFPLIDFFGDSRPEQDRDQSDTTPRLTNIVGRRPSLSPPTIKDPSRPIVSFIILNWNGAPLLDQMLQSVAAQMAGESIELLIVDHGSHDESIEVAEKYRDRLDIRLFARGANFSFSASNNFAAQLARGRYLFLANNDLVFTGNCLPAMASWLDHDPTIGIVGAGLLEPLPAPGGGWRYAHHHRGVHFDPRRWEGDNLAYGPLETVDACSSLGAALEVAAVTGAALLCRRDQFLAIGGLDESYFYGFEDIDFCLRLSRHFGTRIVCDLSATILHNRSFTRTGRLVTGKANPVLTRSSTQSQNALSFNRRFKRQIVRKTLASAIEDETSWRLAPLRVTFVVTDASMVTPAGDFFTALEMAEGLRSLYGWEVLFARIGTTLVSGTDVLVVMRHDFEIANVKGGNPGMVTVAWVRNRVDEWLARRDFQTYNLILSSSQRAIDAIAAATGRVAHLFPIATNEERFYPRPPVAEHVTDIVFTGSSHAGVRDAIGLLEDVELPGDLAIYGFRWDREPRWSRYWRGSRPYWDLPNIYPSAKLVIDDSHPVTRDWNSLNSRIFDTLASGTLVVTNCRGGVDELFDGRLPTFSDSQELANALDYYLRHPEEREALAADMREEVLARHTYKHRARTFKAVLSAFVTDVLRFAIKIGANGPDRKSRKPGTPGARGQVAADDRDACECWQMAVSLQRALQRAGHFVRIDVVPDWTFNESVGDDVVIVLGGAAKFEPAPSKINILWLIDQPDEVSMDRLAGYDHVFTSSPGLTARLRHRLGNRVSTLLPCVDPEIFYPEPDSGRACEIAFVGQAGSGRPDMVDRALQAGLPISIFGQSWDGLVPAQSIRETSLAADDRRAYYSNAKIVLHQHAKSMREEGMLSVWLLEAAACGAVIITDDFPGIAELFAGNVAASICGDDLATLTEALLKDDERRQAMGAALRQMILDHHTADRRVRDILDIVELFQ